MSGFQLKRDPTRHLANEEADDDEDADMTSSNGDDVMSIICRYCASQFVGQTETTCRHDVTATRQCVDAFVKDLSSLARQIGIDQL